MSAEIDFQTRDHMPEILFLGLICHVRRAVPVSRESCSIPGRPSVKNEPAD